MFPSPYRRLLLIYFVVYVSVAVGIVFWIGSVIRSILIDESEQRLVLTENRLQELLLEEPKLGLRLIDHPVSLDLRIALLDANGNVLAASPNQLHPEALAERPDVRDAWKLGSGRLIRTANGDAPASLSISRKVAFPLGDMERESRSTLDSAERTNDSVAIFTNETPNVQEGVLRFSVDLDGIDHHIMVLRWYLALSFSLVGTALFLTYGQVAQAILSPLPRLARFAKSLAQGDLNSSLDLETRQAEWTSLSNAFDQMRQLLSSREQTLREYSHRLETTLANMVEGVIAIRNDGSVTFANSAALKLLSIPNTTPEGKRLYDLVRFPQLIAAYERSISSHQSVKTEFETLGNPRRTVALRIDPITGSPTPGSVLVVRDVTELRQLETMRRDFAANVSHELKTPLAAIKAYAETLRLGAWDDQANRETFVAEIESQADRLHNLIMDLIHLSRIESTDLTIVKEPVELGEIIDEALLPFLGVAQSRQVTLDIIHTDEPVWAFTDAESLITILDNLTSNAIRYTKAGGKVEVRYGADIDHVWLEVEDTGIGIAPEHHSRVFERFYRVDRARSRDVGGTGLGLSIVKHLAQAIDGEITLTSKVGVGTKLRLRLPLVPDSASGV